MEIVVVASNSDTQEETVWEVEKFRDRLLVMRDIYNQGEEDDTQEDPFHEPPQPQLIG